MIPGRRTPEGQLYIIAGPPSDTDPRLAGFALKPTGEIYAAGVTSVFNPADLFLNGEQGAWYDPSDLTTMFQDSAGTTPVTADGQTVGLILDKSKGLVLGSELVTNGTFNTDASGWTTGDVSASVANGKCTITNTAATFGVLYQSFSTTIGRSYKVTASIDASSGTDAILRVYTDAFIGVTVTAGQSKNVSFIFNATVGISIIQCVNGNSSIGANFIIDNISVKEIAGNHAVAPNDAARPLYKTDGTYHWLQFDGVDDSLSTAEIDLTATDEISLFYGATRNNNATSVLIESGSTFNSNNGSFVLISGTDGSTVDGYTFKTRGDINTTLGARVSNLTPPNKSIVSCFGDISADLTTMRVNSVSGTNGTQDQGIGNFGNYSFYICSRAGASLNFNGNIYSLIVRGALSTADEITETEAWVNGKTGAY